MIRPDGTAYCEWCDDLFDYDELISYGGKLLCDRCYADYRREEEEGEDELHG